MAYIKILEDEESPPELRSMYERMAPRGEPVDNILRIHSLNPGSLDVHYRLYKYLMYGPSDLSRAEREMIAVVVSRAHDCHY